jgi:hypothetical protein
MKQPAPEQFDYTRPPPSIESNRAHRAAAMVRLIDEAWRAAELKPLDADAAAIWANLRLWSDSAWSSLALNSGGREGYCPSLDTRAVVMQCYSERAAEFAAKTQGTGT